MNRVASVWVAAVIAALMFAYVTAFGASGGNLVFAFLSILGVLFFSGVALAMRSQADASWLVSWVAIGFLVKAIATWGRHWMVTVFYGGGDALRYYGAGVEIAEEWRSGDVPGLSGAGSQGTQIIESVTGALFAIFTPDILGGFLVFSVVAYFGQLMIYSAFRIWARPHQLKVFAILIFLLPTYSFWPSSIGKDAIVLFLLGGAIYFTARVLQEFHLRHVAGLALFLIPLGLVRIHVAGLVVVGLVGAGIVAKHANYSNAATRLRRLVFIGVTLLAGSVVVATVPDVLGVDLTGEDSIDAFTRDVVRRTTEKGTIAAGGPVTSIADIPGAIVLQLFRPAIIEASEIQHLFAAAETTFLAGFALWFFPGVLRNLRRWRSNPFVVFSTVYVLVYSVAFSIVRQLGIVARQRGQVLAMFLAIVIVLGWEERNPQRFVHPAFRTDQEERLPPLARASDRVGSDHLASHASQFRDGNLPTSSF